ncbi:carbohydrate sulfotransferase 11-like [Oratosquilla oratoria]|uniref:carbohydrate sulfotransferase 11-like n=1 Tax=Oratosquilla oratoria TaxID=337810 RepID=UPI003F774A7B
MDEDSRQGRGGATSRPVQMFTECFIYTENESSSRIDEWMKRIERRFEARKAVLTDGCSRVKDIVKEDVELTLRYRLFSAPNYNLTVCLNEKPMNFFTEEKLYLLMTKGTSKVKVFVVRHPLHRLVSAYRDKYQNGASLRVKDFPGRFVPPVINEQKLKVDSHGNISITFPQFLKHVVQEHRNNLWMNRHWRSYVKNCSPCTFNYTYIMTMETWDEDMDYLIKKLNISEVQVSTHINSKSTLSQGGRVDYFSYYRNIDPHLIRTIYEIFKVDFELFNYTLPAFIEKSITAA